MSKDVTSDRLSYAVPRLIFALDVPDLAEAERLAQLLVGRVGMFKIGLELFTAVGPDAVRVIRDAGGEVFLDLKLHDIPATAARAAAAASVLGVRMLTVHALGGVRMIAAAVQSSREAASAAGRLAPDVIAVTALTSHGQRDMQQLGLGQDVPEVVERLVRIAHASGAHGVVASAWEVQALRGLLGPDATIVTPGVRPAWYEPGDDQTRIATPTEAIALGSDYVVIGRPIRDADNPQEAADRVLEEISEGIRMKARQNEAGSG